MLATWIAFLVYSAAAIGLGWLAHRRRESGAAYWTAGRSLGAAAVGLSISAGFLSVSWSCVYAVQLFYWYGLGAVWLITVPWLIALASIYMLAGRYHDLPAFSQPEMVGARFGKGSRRIVALALAFVFLVWGGAEIYVAAILLAPAMQVSSTSMVILISLVVGTYATLGGFRAVVNTDKLQYAIVVMFIVAMAWLAWRGLAALPADRSLAELTGAKSAQSWQAWLAPGLVTILLTLAAYLPGWIFETDLWLRVQAAKDQRAARRGVLLAAVNGFLFVGLLPMFIGISALAIFPLVEGQFPAIVGNEGDAIFAALVQIYAPGWLQIGVAVGLVAAAMSTIDTCSNVMALSLAYDVFELHEKPRAGRASQMVTAASVIAACIFALNTESLWDIFYLSSGILTTTVAFPVAAVFLPGVKSRAVGWSAGCGFVGTTFAYFLESRGFLSAMQPLWLTDSSLAFIFWGILAAAAGATLGQMTSTEPAPVSKD
jgi:Na+/proline symporter